MMLQRHLARVGLTELELKLRLRLGEDRYRASRVGEGRGEPHLTGSTGRYGWAERCTLRDGIA